MTELTPLTITRDPQRYQQWWTELEAERAQRIGELVAELASPDATGRAPSEVEFTLHWLMLEAFQSSPSAAAWLRVDGLADGAQVSYACLDIDPYYGTDGVLDGAEIGLSLHVARPPASARAVLMVAVYVDKPWKELVVTPELIERPGDALAEIADTALALINAEIAARDRFTTSMRRWAAPTGNGR